MNFGTKRGLCSFNVKFLMKFCEWVQHWQTNLLVQLFVPALTWYRGVFAALQSDPDALCNTWHVHVSFFFFLFNAFICVPVALTLFFLPVFFYTCFWQTWEVQLCTSTDIKKQDTRRTQGNISNIYFSALILRRMTLDSVKILSETVKTSYFKKRNIYLFDNSS